MSPSILKTGECFEMPENPGATINGMPPAFVTTGVTARNITNVHHELVHRYEHARDTNLALQ